MEPRDYTKEIEVGDIVSFRNNKYEVVFCNKRNVMWWSGSVLQQIDRIAVELSEKKNDEVCDVFIWIGYEGEGLFRWEELTESRNEYRRVYNSKIGAWENDEATGCTITH
jgi:hypothetical protein